MPSNVGLSCIKALVVAQTKLFEPAVQSAMMEIGSAHLRQPFLMAFIRAIFAEWLIALMVWLLPGADASRISIVIILTHIVGLGSLNHAVAGSTTHAS
jgi:formate/nitrite transporter FocA (FNT family)